MSIVWYSAEGPTGPVAKRFREKAREARLRTLAEGGRTSAEAEARAEADASGGAQ